MSLTFAIESQTGVHLGRPGRRVGQVQVDNSSPLLGQLGPGLGVAVVHREVGDWTGKQKEHFRKILEISMFLLCHTETAYVPCPPLLGALIAFRCVVMV